MKNIMSLAISLRSAATALLLLAMIALSPAHAQTVTGTANPFGGFATLNAPVVPAPGLYEYTFQFSRPGAGIAIVEYVQTYNVFDTGGNFLFGNDLTLDSTFLFPTPVTSGSFIFELPRPYSTPVAGGVENGLFYATDAFLDFDFGTDDPVDFSISLARYIPTAGGIPEPATWAMMVLGLGAIGAAMRRRRALVPAAA